MSLTKKLELAGFEVISSKAEPFLFQKYPNVSRKVPMIAKNLENNPHAAMSFCISLLKEVNANEVLKKITSEFDKYFKKYPPEAGEQ